jgi:WxcM-like protein
VTGPAAAQRLATWALVEVPTAADGRGSLCFTEGKRHVPFSIERVYWIHDIPSDTRRGSHSHRSVQELIVAVAGEFNVYCDNGLDQETIHLDGPSLGLLVDSGVWRELDAFSPGAVCLVLASGAYEEDEYVRDYSAFTALARPRRFVVPLAWPRSAPPRS